MWNLEEKKEEFTLKGHTKYITHVAISQDGMYLVSGSGDKTIKFWDFKQKKEEFSFTGHTSTVNSVAISQDGRYLVSGSDDSTIKV